MEFVRTWKLSISWLAPRSPVTVVPPFVHCMGFHLRAPQARSAIPH